MGHLVFTIFLLFLLTLYLFYRVYRIDVEVIKKGKSPLWGFFYLSLFTAFMIVSVLGSYSNYLNSKTYLLGRETEESIRKEEEKILNKNLYKKVKYNKMSCIVVDYYIDRYTGRPSNIEDGGYYKLMCLERPFSFIQAKGQDLIWIENNTE